MYDRFIERVAKVAPVGFADGELMYIMEVTQRPSFGIDQEWQFCVDREKAEAITYDVEDAFNEYPGSYEKACNIDKEKFLSKFHSLDDTSRATVAVWSKLLWSAEPWTRKTPFLHLFAVTCDNREQLVDEAVRWYLSDYAGVKISLAKGLRFCFDLMDFLKNKGVNEETCMLVYLVKELFRGLSAEEKFDVWAEPS